MRDSVEDSIVLFERAGRLLMTIDKEYQKSVDTGTVSSELRIAIRDYLGDIRSTLDYLAWDIFTDKCMANIDAEKLNATMTRIQFPILDEKKEFDKRIRNNFKGLSSEIVDVLESVQSYKTADDTCWIKLLQELNNENKHRNLTRQKKRTKQQINNLQIAQEGVNFTFVGCTSNLEDIEFMKMLTGSSITDKELRTHPDVAEYDVDMEVKLLFKELDAPVLDTLQKIHRGASELTQKILSVI